MINDLSLNALYNQQRHSSPGELCCRGFIALDIHSLVAIEHGFDYNIRLIIEPFLPTISVPTTVACVGRSMKSVPQLGHLFLPFLCVIQLNSTTAFGPYSNMYSVNKRQIDGRTVG